MSKKSQNKSIRLIASFVILLVAVVGLQLSKSKKGERSFKAELMEFNTEEVVSIDLKGQAAGFQALHIALDNGKWVIRANDRTYDADPDLITNMINELSQLKAVQKVAAQKDKWADFDVTDSSGVRVTVNSDKKVVGDLYIGRFTYNQNTRKPKTYVRINKDKDVFAVEGYLSMTFNRDLNGLRNKTIFRGNRNDISKISLNYPADSSFTLSKEGMNWLINGSPADSVQASNFLGAISYLTGAEFRDDISPANLDNAPFSVVLEGANMPTVEIKAIQESDGRTAIRSSLNPGAVFSGETGNLFSKIFAGPNRFFPKPSANE